MTDQLKQDALDAVRYSYNFAKSKPDILPMEREHIIGLGRVILRLIGRDDLLEEASQ